MGWQDDFKLVDDLRQRHLYAFDEALRALGGLSFAGGGSISAQHALCAAIKAGWIETPAVEVGTFDQGERFYLGGEDVGELHGGKVFWYGSQVTKAYQEAIKIPPN